MFCCNPCSGFPKRVNARGYCGAQGGQCHCGHRAALVCSLGKGWSDRAPFFCFSVCFRFFGASLEYRNVLFKIYMSVSVIRPCQLILVPESQHKPSLITLLLLLLLLLDLLLGYYYYCYPGVLTMLSV